MWGKKIEFVSVCYFYAFSHSCMTISSRHYFLSLFFSYFIRILGRLLSFSFNDILLHTLKNVIWNCTVWSMENIWTFTYEENSALQKSIMTTQFSGLSLPLFYVLFIPLLLVVWLGIILRVFFQRTHYLGSYYSRLKIWTWIHILNVIWIRWNTKTHVFYTPHFILNRIQDDSWSVFHSEPI